MTNICRCRGNAYIQSGQGYNSDYTEDVEIGNVSDKDRASKEKITTLQRKLNLANKEISRLKHKNEQLEENFQMLFNFDKIKYL